jgi:preprotein translocase subunit SecD
VVGAQSIGPNILFTLSDAGGKLFAKLTGDHLPDTASGTRYRLGIILDGVLYYAPTIQRAISTGGEIIGRFTNGKATEIAETLNAGSPPVRIRLVPTPKTVTPADDGEG